MKLTTLFTALLLPLAAARGLDDLDEAHVDLGLNYNATLNQWQLTVRDEDNTKEYAADRVILRGAISARVTLPNDARYAFLGAPGAPSYILPQTQEPELLYLGFSTENKTSVIDDWTADGVSPSQLVKGLNSGTFLSNQITLSLQAVSGPGNFALYRTSPGGDPVVTFDSGNGIDANDRTLFNPNVHAHFNWAFSAPGTYAVTLQASGLLAGNSQFTQSAPTTFTFQIVPEPGTAILTLGGLALLALPPRRRRR